MRMLIHLDLYIHITCVLPPGMGANKFIVLKFQSFKRKSLHHHHTHNTTTDGVLTKEEILGLKNPWFTCADRTWKLASCGVNLGAPRMKNPTAFVGGRSCTATKWVSSREISTALTGRKFDLGEGISGDCRAPSQVPPGTESIECQRCHRGTSLRIRKDRIHHGIRTASSRDQALSTSLSSRGSTEIF